LNCDVTPTELSYATAGSDRPARLNPVEVFHRLEAHRKPPLLLPLLPLLPLPRPLPLLPLPLPPPQPLPIGGYRGDAQGGYRRDARGAEQEPVAGYQPCATRSLMGAYGGSGAAPRQLGPQLGAREEAVLATPISSSSQAAQGIPFGYGQAPSTAITAGSGGGSERPRTPQQAGAAIIREPTVSGNNGGKKGNGDRERNSAAAEMSEITSHMLSAIQVVGGVSRELSEHRSRSSEVLDLHERELDFLKQQMATVRMALGGPKNVPSLDAEAWGNLRFISRQAEAMAAQITSSHNELAARVSASVEATSRTLRAQADSIAKIEGVDERLKAAVNRSADSEARGARRTEEVLERCAALIDQRAQATDEAFAREAVARQNEKATLERTFAQVERAMDEQRAEAQNAHQATQAARDELSAAIARIAGLEGARAAAERRADASERQLLALSDRLSHQEGASAELAADVAESANRQAGLREAITASSANASAAASALEERLAAQARATAVSTGELRNAITEAESGLLAETRGLALELDRWRRSADAIDARAIALSDGHGGVRAQLEQMGGRYAALEGAVAQLAARAALRSEPQQQSQQQPQQQRGIGSIGISRPSVSEYRDGEAMGDRLGALEHTVETLMSARLDSTAQLLERNRTSMPRPVPGTALDLAGGEVTRRALSALREDFEIAVAKMGARVDEANRSGALSVGLSQGVERRMGALESSKLALSQAEHFDKQNDLTSTQFNNTVTTAHERARNAIAAIGVRGDAPHLAAAAASGAMGAAAMQPAPASSAATSRMFDSLVQRVVLVERRLELGGAIDSWADAAGDNNGGMGSPGIHNSGLGLSGRPLLARAHAELADAHAALVRRVERFESSGGGGAGFGNSPYAAQRFASHTFSYTNDGAEGEEIDEAASVRLERTEAQVQALQGYMAQQQEALLSHLASLETSMGRRIAKVSGRLDSGERPSLGGDGDLAPLTRWETMAESSALSSRVTLLESRQERFERGTSQRFAAVSETLSSQGNVLDDLRSKVLRASLSSPRASAGVGLSAPSAALAVVSVGASGPLGSEGMRAIRQSIGDLSTSPAATPRGVSPPRGVVNPRESFGSATPSRGSIYASLVRAGASLLLVNRAEGKLLKRWVQLSADGRQISIIDTNNRNDRLAILTKDVTAIRIGPVRPLSASAPWLHFQLELRAPSGGVVANSITANLPLEFVATDGPELITWLLGLQAVVVPAKPFDRLTLGRIARRRCRMISRLFALRSGLSYHQYWASVILNSAATLGSQQGAAAERWNASRDGLQDEVRKGSYRDAIGGAAPRPSSARASLGGGGSSYAGANSNLNSGGEGYGESRFSAAARRADERRASSRG